MCAVSAMYDYGRSLPQDFWDPYKLYEFQKMIEQAMKFDQRTGQPDCEDPTKSEWIEEVKHKVRP